MTRRAVTFIAAVALVLAAAAPTAGRPDPPSLPGPITSATPLDFSGLGPIRIGMSLSEARRASGQRLPYTASTASARCGYAPVGPKSLGATLGVGDGVVLLVQLRRSPIRVRGGGRVGDTLTDLRRQYGARLRRDHHNPYVRTLTEGRRRIVFSVDANNPVDVITAGERPAIDWNHLCG